MRDGEYVTSPNLENAKERQALHPGYISIMLRK